LFGLRQFSLIATILFIAFSAPWPLVPAGMSVQAATFTVTPSEVVLVGRFARTQVLVAERVEGVPAERGGDLTTSATYGSSNEAIFQVNDGGVIAPLADGEANLTVTVGAETQEIPVRVTGIAVSVPVDFATQVRPVISKAGCNMGACHAAQHGKGGFKLSVFGFDPENDHKAITRDHVQRRVNFLDPARSLFVQKPTMQVPHGGGLRLRAGSNDHELLLAWLAQGASGMDKDAPTVTQLDVLPKRRVSTPDETQQLRVVASYSDGSSRDVTAWCKFDSSDDGVVAVTTDGKATAVGRGQANVMARFEGHAQITMFVIPYADSIELAGWENKNFVDELAANKFRELGIEPVGLCDDATFIRRAFLDATGSLPTVDECTKFIASTDANKREHLVDQLLGLTGDPDLDIYNNRYTAYWTLKWSDLIRNTSNKLGEQGMWSLHNWIRQAFRENMPFDQFVRHLVTGTGSIYSNGPANYFRINQNATDLTESTSQLFLGVRLECAKCHHHPFEKYSQDDYYGFAAFFARVGTKNSEEFGLFGREQVVMVKPTGEVRNPRTGKNMLPTPLHADPVDHPLDRRIALADWLTASENEGFANAVVNRYVYSLLGRGLVEPVDDLRSTNPPSNVALMNALAKDFVAKKFDLKQLIRTIMTSRLYQLSSQPTASNASDRRFYSHFQVKRLAAEPLLDSIDQVTGIRTKFKNLPLGTRAIDLPDAEYPNYFLKTFAKPRRASVCECERSPDESLGQALHGLNGEIIAQKISHKDGHIAKLLKDERPAAEKISQVYMATLCRPASAAELESLQTFLAESPSPQEFYQDLLWALINSKQFMFVH
jgi:hypothetical protein